MGVVGVHYPCASVAQATGLCLAATRRQFRDLLRPQADRTQARAPPFRVAGRRTGQPGRLCYPFIFSRAALLAIVRRSC